MKLKTTIALSFLFALALLQGCAGVRNSYESALQQDDGQPVLKVKKDETIELLAIGDGFPGWWGYYPYVISLTPAVASVDCREARSAVPFRKPGLLFGGEICDLIAHKQGETTLFFGSKYSVSPDNYVEKVDVVVTNN